MAHETDFIDLYRKLRLEPGCTLDDFKQAYRRHVALWHPDRRRGSRADTLAAARLQRLTVQYAAAMDFHRRHGRLPGAPIGARSAGPRVEAERDEASTAAPLRASMPPSARPRARVAMRWWLAGVVLGIGALAVWMWPDDEPVETESVAEPVAMVEHDRPAARFIALGMTPADVAAIEGEPTRRGADRWEYGPSWVRFEGGAVTDWYSSPLRNLRTASTRAH
ncbi:J domain-containing protein [Luteibacter sp. UNCMF366Tsu5.1]|uniref:J domain-containing protein n=1 Tax=Luteibacter sp. UNCMF366Tsu5.1 TaxID=1502758 RepID=UPI000908824F|nr:J domain-containing protein [Luteibacter sp. UNCMF366Tsu5.1]SFW22229.1 hypothetical protein SAMN02800691_0380 [Luteibacter sp. UNCMF366Tsu5.1]